MVSTAFEKEVLPDTSNGIKVEYLINHDLMLTDEFDDFLILSGGFIPIAKRNMSYGITEMKSQVEEIELEITK